MSIESKILTQSLRFERDMYRDAYENYKKLLAKYEGLLLRAIELVKAAHSDNDELAAKLRIANAALEMARKSAAEKDEEMAVLRRDLLRNGYGRDNW